MAPAKRNHSSAEQKNRKVRGQFAPGKKVLQHHGADSFQIPSFADSSESEGPHLRQVDKNKYEIEEENAKPTLQQIAVVAASAKAKNKSPLTIVEKGSSSKAATKRASGRSRNRRAKAPAWTSSRHKVVYHMSSDESDGRSTDYFSGEGEQEMCSLRCTMDINDFVAEVMFDATHKIQAYITRRLDDNDIELIGIRQRKDRKNSGKKTKAKK